ncbi:MAG TPA: hypothetical protein VFG64_01295 [Dongiaceae bacterium]|nr:hypothetical protein [Dongiaceae bacterium]
MSDYVHVISVPLKPRDAQAAIALRAALDTLCAADPKLAAEAGSDDAVILKGQTEDQLEIAVYRAKRAFKVDFDVGAPQVGYCESITKTIEWEYTYKSTLAQRSSMQG